MPTQLLTTAGPDKGRTFVLSADTTMVIGRGPNTQTKLVDLHVSRVHCEVLCDGNKLIVKDAGGVGGTFVNGQRVTKDTEVHAGDLIRIGETEFRVETDVAEQSTITPEPAAAAEVVFANKPGVRPLPPQLKQLHDLIGTSIGRYKLHAILGTGQIGVVFRAQDSVDSKLVALKILRADFAKDDKAVQRFVRGMKTASALNHPHLIALYNAGVAAPHCWIAMELVEGESLADVMKRGPVDWSQAWHWCVQMASALGYLHERDIIHRNVMPQNILIQKKDQTAKLGDAMLAKALHFSGSEPITETGELVGNMFYMAPERTIKGAGIDGRSDLYSLGVTMYALIAGRLPFMATSLPELILQIRKATPSSLRNSRAQPPEAFERIIFKLLAKQPAGRYGSSTELLADLERVKPKR